MAQHPEPGKTALPSALFVLFALAYVVAVAVAIIGTQGYFGQSPDGLAAVFLILVGIPWSLSSVVVGLAEWPIIIGQIIIVCAPLITLYRLWRAIP